MEHLDNQQIAARFAELPKIVQDAITSAQIEKHMREISREHQLHLDLWGLLENQVMLTVMGVQRAEDLARNVSLAIGVDDATAKSIAEDISRIVFNPIRLELEHKLAEIETPPKTAASAAPNGSDPDEQAAAIAPIAPVPAPPETRSKRASLSDSYTPGATSSTRKDVESDPYREPPA